MRAVERLIGLLLVGAGLALVAPLSAATPEAELTTAQQETRLAKRIAGALEAGHVIEAHADAEEGVTRLPASALLRRRLGQVHVCLALQRDAELQQALEDARFGQYLGNAVSWLHHGTEPLPERTAEQREEFTEFLLFASGPLATQFQERGLEAM